MKTEALIEVLQEFPHLEVEIVTDVDLPTDTYGSSDITMACSSSSSGTTSSNLFLLVPESLQGNLKRPPFETPMNAEALIEVLQKFPNLEVEILVDVKGTYGSTVPIAIVSTTSRVDKWFLVPESLHNLFNRLKQPPLPD